MRCRTGSWLRSLRALFSPVRQVQRSRFRRPLVLERLEDRTAPAVFNPVSVAGDGVAAGQLRGDIITANNNPDAINTFNLDGGMYSLTIANGAGQENLSAQGDLDLINLNVGAAPTKTYIFVGNGSNINQTQLDRVFQVLAGPGGTQVIVQFQNVDIMSGQAVDDGTAGVAPGTTDAKGGGILNRDPIINSGGDIAFTNAIVSGNAATGAAGAPGLTGVDGGNGRNADGGGLNSQGGVLT